MLEWKDAYSTGIKEIDEQHKILFQYINDLEQVIKGEKSAGYVRIILEFLGEYAQTHFGYEENCMFERHCPVADQNKTAHKKFMEAYHHFQERFDLGEDSDQLLRDIHTMMHAWLINHICKIDVHLRGCAKRRI